MQNTITNEYYEYITYTYIYYTNNSYKSILVNHHCLN